MATTTKGFFVPESFSANYVSNLRDEEGTYKYENQLRDVGIQKQAAIQDLNKTYSDTINNAYSSYLNSKRSIMSSNIGEGYKQAYLQGQEAQLQQNMAQASVNAASTRQQIETQEAKASEEIGEAFKTEVSNMNRVAESMQQYLVYLKGLTKGKGDQAQKYITKDQEKYRLDQMYDVVFNAQPYDYADASGAPGASYIEWATTQIKNTEADRDWFNWLTTYGGLQQFKQAAQPLVEKEATRRRTETPGTEEYTQSLYDPKTFSQKTGDEFLAKSYMAVTQGNKTVGQGWEKNMQLWRDELDLTNDEIKSVLLATSLVSEAEREKMSMAEAYELAMNTMMKSGKGYDKRFGPVGGWDVALTKRMIEKSKKKHTKTSE